MVWWASRLQFNYVDVLDQAAADTYLCLEVGNGSDISQHSTHTSTLSPTPEHKHPKKRTEDAAQEARADADQGKEKGVLARPDRVPGDEGVAHGGLCVILFCMGGMDKIDSSKPNTLHSIPPPTISLL